MRLRAPGGQRGAGRPRGDAGRRRLRLAASSCSPRSTTDSTIAKFLDRNGPGHPAARLPGHRHRRGQRDPARARPAAALRRAAPRHGGLAGSTSSTPRTPAACSSSWSSRPPRHTETVGDDQVTPACAPTVTRAVISGPIQPDARSRSRTCSTSSTRSMRRQTRRRRATSPNLELPESYRAVTVHKDEVDMFEGLAARTRTRASPCTSRTSRCPSSARARRCRGDGLARSTTTPCGPRSSSRSRRSASSSATAGSRRSAKRHDLPYHVVGSDLSGVVLRTGAGRAPSGSPATRSSRTASRSSWRAPTATTTRCSTPSSGSGASRPTSAAWPRSPWSRPTS